MTVRSVTTPSKDARGRRVKTLDQFIADRFGIAVPAAERWRKNDQGLHVIAAALYEVVGEDHYDETGGNVGAYCATPTTSGASSPRSTA